jgi:hypothetical protein
MRHEFNLSAEQQTTLDVVAQENGQTSGGRCSGAGATEAMCCCERSLGESISRSEPP